MQSEIKSEKILTIAKWIELQIENNPFSDITVKISIHEGKIKRIERGLNEKIQG